MFRIFSIIFVHATYDLYTTAVPYRASESRLLYKYSLLVCGGRRNHITIHLPEFNLKKDEKKTAL